MAPNRFPSGISKVIQMLRVKTLEIYVNMYICVYGSHLPSTGFLILNFFLMLDKAKKKRLDCDCSSVVKVLIELPSLTWWLIWIEGNVNIPRDICLLAHLGIFQELAFFKTVAKKKRAAHLVYVCIYYIL